MKKGFAILKSRCNRHRDSLFGRRFFTALAVFFLTTQVHIPPELTRSVLTDSLEAAPNDPDGLEDSEEESPSPSEKSPANPNPRTQDGENSEKRRESLEQLKQRIQYSNSTDRRNAIRDLKRLKKEERDPFIPLVALIAKTDQDASVRESAMRWLVETETNTKDSQEAFLAGLDDAERNVKLEALRGIRHTGLKEAGERLAKLVLESNLTQNDPVVHSAIRTLGQMGTQTTPLTDHLLTALDDPATDMESRRAILLYAGALKMAAMQSKLLKILADSNADLMMRSYSANALGKRASREGGTATTEEKETIRKALQTALEEIRAIRDSRQRARYSMLKQQCILALIRMGDPSVSGELRAAAQDDDASTRLRAIRFMGELKLAEFRDLIRFKAKHDESSRVRKEAERVIKEMDR